MEQDVAVGNPKRRTSANIHPRFPSPLTLKWVDKYSNLPEWTEFKKKKDSEILIKLMDVFIKNITITSIKCLKETSLYTELKNVIMSYSAEFYNDCNELELENNEILLHRLRVIIAKYIDLEIRSSRYSDKKVFVMAENVISVLLAHFEGGCIDILKTILHTTYLTVQFDGLWNIIFRKFLQHPPPPGTSMSTYILYILAFKVWRIVTRDKQGKRTITKMAVANLKLPKEFLNKCIKSGIIPKVLPKVPESITSIISFFMEVKSDFRTKSKIFLNMCARRSVALILDGPNALKKNKLLFGKSSSHFSEIVKVVTEKDTHSSSAANEDLQTVDLCDDDEVICKVEVEDEEISYESINLCDNEPTYQRSGSTDGYTGTKAGQLITQETSEINKTLLTSSDNLQQVTIADQPSINEFHEANDHTQDETSLSPSEENSNDLGEATTSTSNILLTGDSEIYDIIQISSKDSLKNITNNSGYYNNLKSNQNMIHINKVKTSEQKYIKSNENEINIIYIEPAVMKDISLRDDLSIVEDSQMEVDIDNIEDNSPLRDDTQEIVQLPLNGSLQIVPSVEDESVNEEHREEMTEYNGTETEIAGLKMPVKILSLVTSNDVERFFRDFSNNPLYPQCNDKEKQIEENIHRMVELIVDSDILTDTNTVHFPHVTSKEPASSNINSTSTVTYGPPKLNTTENVSLLTFEKPMIPSAGTAQPLNNTLDKKSNFIISNVNLNPNKDLSIPVKYVNNPSVIVDKRASDTKSPSASLLNIPYTDKKLNSTPENIHLDPNSTNENHFENNSTTPISPNSSFLNRKYNIPITNDNPITNPKNIPPIHNDFMTPPKSVSRFLNVNRLVNNDSLPVPTDLTNTNQIVKSKSSPPADPGSSKRKYNKSYKSNTLSTNTTNMISSRSRTPPTDTTNMASNKSDTPPTVTPPTDTPPTDTPPTDIPPTHIPPTHIPPTHIPPAHIPPAHISPAHIPPTHISRTHIRPTHIPPIDTPPTHIPPTHIPPIHIPPAHISPAHIPPTHISRTHIPPTHIQPTHIQPTHIPPTHIQPTPIPPTDTPPTHIQPTHIPPTHIQPTHILPTHIQLTHIQPTHMPLTHMPPTHIQPTHIQPTHIQPSHIQPTHIQPTHIQPTHIQPTHIQPTHIQPSHIQPTHIQPTHIQPTHIQPTHIQPTHIQPTHIPPNHIAPTHIPPTHIPPTHIPPTHIPPTYIPPAHIPPTDPTNMSYYRSHTPSCNTAHISSYKNYPPPTNITYVSYNENPSSYTSIIPSYNNYTPSSNRTILKPNKRSTLPTNTNIPHSTKNESRQTPVNSSTSYVNQHQIRINSSLFSQDAHSINNRQQYNSPYQTMNTTSTPIYYPYDLGSQPNVSSQMTRSFYPISEAINSSSDRSSQVNLGKRKRVKKNANRSIQNIPLSDNNCHSSVNRRQEVSSYRVENSCGNYLVPLRNNITFSSSIGRSEWLHSLNSVDFITGFCKFAGLFKLNSLPDRLELDVELPPFNKSGEKSNNIKAKCDIYGGLNLTAFNFSLYLSNTASYVIELKERLIQDHSQLSLLYSNMHKHSSALSQEDIFHMITITKDHKIYLQQEEALASSSDLLLNYLILLLEENNSSGNCKSNRCSCRTCSTNHMLLLANFNILQKVLIICAIFDSYNSLFRNSPQRRSESDEDRSGGSSSSQEGCALPLKKRCRSPGGKEQDFQGYPASRMLSIAHLVTYSNQSALVCQAGATSQALSNPTTYNSNQNYLGELQGSRFDHAHMANNIKYSLDISQFLLPRNQPYRFQ